MNYKILKKKDYLIMMCVKICSLLFLIFTFARSKVHGAMYQDGSYSDFTVHVSLHQFIFGTTITRGKIPPNGLLMFGFYTFIASIVMSFVCIIITNKKTTLITFIVSVFAAIGLSPIGIVQGVITHNKSIIGNYSDYISMGNMPYIYLLVLIIFAVVDLMFYLRESKGWNITL